MYKSFTFYRIILEEKCGCIWDFCAAGFLGDVAEASADPLHPHNLYRRHHHHGMLYQNWSVVCLKDGDILVVRNHEAFFTALNSLSPALYSVLGAPGAVTLPDSLPEVPQAEELTPPTFRMRALRFVTDPNSSRCWVLPSCRHAIDTDPKLSLQCTYKIALPIDNMLDVFASVQEARHTA